MWDRINPALFTPKDGDEVRAALDRIRREEDRVRLEAEARVKAERERQWAEAEAEAEAERRREWAEWRAWMEEREQERAEREAEKLREEEEHFEAVRSGRIPPFDPYESLFRLDEEESAEYRDLLERIEPAPAVSPTDPKPVDLSGYSIIDLLDMDLS
ncbi:hypothetical protein [Actinocorallia aurantiaca]